MTLARKIEGARVEIGKGRVEMSAADGRWWVRYISIENASTARWLGQAANATMIAEAMHQAGEIAKSEIAQQAQTLQAQANGKAGQGKTY